MKYFPDLNKFGDGKISVLFIHSFQSICASVCLLFWSLSLTLAFSHCVVHKEISMFSVFFCLFLADRLWRRPIRVSLYPKPWAWWRARLRSAACTPSSGQSAPPHLLQEIPASVWPNSLFLQPDFMPGAGKRSGVLTAGRTLPVCVCRNKETNRDEFIFYSKRLMRLLIEHALSFLPLKVRLFSINISRPSCPLEQTKCKITFGFELELNFGPFLSRPARFRGDASGHRLRGKEAERSKSKNQNLIDSLLSWFNVWTSKKRGNF